MPEFFYFNHYDEALLTKHFGSDLAKHEEFFSVFLENNLSGFVENSQVDDRKD